MATTYDEFGSIVADDDSGSNSSQNTNDGTTESTAGQTFYENDGTTSTDSSMDSESETITVSQQTTTNAGTTVFGKSGASNAGKKSGPGKRLHNPLGNFSSYTYQISLYMVTPEAYNAFVNSGRKNINQFNRASAQALTNAGGIFLVAQSGGINNSTSQRAPGFNFDYYIDNLVIESSASGKETGGAFNATQISFTITEPYGFSFVTNLKKAMDELQTYSKLRGYNKLTTAQRNFFVLGVRFLGYDKNGELIAGSNGATDAQYQQYYDIIIEEMKFKIDGKIVNYNCSAKILQTQGGFGIKYGRTKNDVTAVGNDVGSILNGQGNYSGLLTQLNKQQIDMEKAGQLKKANTYDIVFIGPEGNLISKSSIINLKADPDKTKQPVSTAKNLSQVNEQTAIKSTPNSTTTTMVFKADTSILQCIQLAIKQSSYIQDALQTFYTSETEPDQQTDSLNEVTGKNRKLKYYNVSTNLNVLEYDTVLNDWVYAITYIVEPYEIPVVQAVGANGSTSYYGPVKRYEYWYTGKNSEILSYEQSYDNLFMIAAVGATGVNGDSTPASGDNVTPVTPNLRSNSPRQNTLGAQGEVENGITTFLTDPKSMAEAKITILGDPDFIMYPNSSKLITGEYDPFYGSNGYSINPNGGQVFIEIDFKEAIDYDNNTGVMSLNDKIMWFKYPPNIQAVAKGIIYLVVKVRSEFKGGKFTQVLDLKLFPMGANAGDGSQAFKENNRLPATSLRMNAASDPRSLTNQGGQPTTSSTGLKTDPEVDTPASATEATWYDYDAGTGQQTSPTGSGAASAGEPVADDDASKTAPTPESSTSVPEENARE